MALTFLESDDSEYKDSKFKSAIEKKADWFEGYTFGILSGTIIAICIVAIVLSCCSPKRETTAKQETEIVEEETYEYELVD